MPEFKLGQPPDEGAELLVLFGGQASLAVFETFVLCEGGVKFWL